MADKRKEQLAALVTEINTKNAAVNALFDAADKRTGADNGVSTAEEIGQIKTLNKEIEELSIRRAEQEELLGIQAASTKRSSELNDVNRPPFHNSPSPVEGTAFKSISDMVFDDEHMKSWLSQHEMTFKSGLASQLNSPRVEVKSFLSGRGNGATPAEMSDYLKTVITGVTGQTAQGGTSGGALVFPDFKPIVDSSYARPLTIRDLITIGQTSGDTVEYVRITGVTNAAGAVAEATASDDGSGAKPESAMAFVRIAETVKTIAHWVPATSRALADAGQLRTYIDQFLRYGIDEELEDQIMNGSGAGENFSGVTVVSGTTPQAFDTDVLTTTRKGRTKVRITGRAMPTAYVMHPNDWQAIDLLQDNEARYYYGGPAQMGQPRLWGLPVVESEAATEGQAVVADWKLAVLWDRMQTAISMSNSHSDFFVRNLIAILAEMRAAFGVLRPKAFVLCDLTA